MRELFKKIRPFKTVILAAALVAVIGGGATVAYTFGTSEKVQNIFQADNLIIDTEIKEEREGTTKRAVIYNQNTCPVYIRAKVVVSPEDVAAANILTTAYDDGTVTIGGTEYTVKAGQWVDGQDGWYYYLAGVKYGESTGLLMDSWHALGGVDYEGALDIYIYEESIQTASDSAATLADMKMAFGN